MKRLILGFLSLLTVGQMALVALPVGAQTSGQIESDPLKLLQQTNVQQGGAAEAGRQLPLVIGRIIRTILGLLGIIFLVLMVYAGFLWMTARGDSKKVDQAKQLITGAIIGVIIISSAYAITAWVLTAATGTNLVSSEEESSGEEESGGGEKKASGESCVADEDCASDTCAFSLGQCSNDADVECFDDTDCSGGTCEGATDKKCD